MAKELVENYKNVLKISDLRDYLLLRKNKILTSWIIKLNDYSIGLILEKDGYEWYLKVFVDTKDIIFNRLDTNNYWYVIHLTTSKCNYGWFRRWFVCPWNWKKCSNLYLTNDWKFYSRKFLNLSYFEQRLSKWQRFFDEMNWKYEIKATELKSNIKYKKRNWFKTRKQRKLEDYELKIKTKHQKAFYFAKKLNKLNSILDKFK